MCLHASWMPTAQCSTCNPALLKSRPAPTQKRPPIPAGLATPTADIDPQSVPVFADSDPRGLLHDQLLHRKGPGSHATVKLRDCQGRALSTSVARALWARHASMGEVEHATAYEDIVHDAEGCPAEIINEHGCRYNCTDIAHYRKVSLN